MNSPVPNSARPLWQRLLFDRWVLLGILLAASIVALRGGWLRGDLLNPNKPSWPASYDPSFPRACSSTGTLFAHLDRPEIVMNRFREAVATVMIEREQLLNNPFSWPCVPDEFGSTEPPMPSLNELANALPGWHRPVRNLFGTVTYERKPVTFASFASILMEFHREYECTLLEMQGKSVPIVLQGFDEEGPLAPEQLDELTWRSWQHQLTVEEERGRSRLALERSIETLRSFETNAAFQAHLSCLQREVLDLNAELSLLADSISCLPKIWDSMTSLHKRTEPK